MRTNRLFLALGVGLSLLLVACGVSGPGSTWTPRTSNTNQHLYGVTYGNGTFVAVGEGGTILTSQNGQNWTPRESGTTQPLYGVTYGNGTFVAVGKNGTILTSP